MEILVINAGSSSLKYQLIDTDNESVIAKGVVERIGIEGANLKHKPAGKKDVRIEQDMKDHTDAIKLVIEALLDKEHGVIDSMDRISAVGHRVVHGGEKFSESVIIDEDVMKAIEANIDLAPLHNPANIMGIQACTSIMPNTPQVAVFDTAFHQSMPPKAYLYGIPYEFYKENKVRRYGFHGTSHRYVSAKAAEIMGKDIKDLKIITCHLGNGGSVAAVDGGKSMDPSMGLTPLEGVLMGTRCGDIDPAIIEFIMDKRGMSISEAMNVLNKESGVLGVSGISSDMRDIESAMLNGDDRATFTYSLYSYRVRKYIGAYAAVMGGVDCIVFTAGIGENNPIMCSETVDNLEYMGIKVKKPVDTEKKEIVQLSADDSKVAVYVIATDEELMIAKDTKALVEGKK